MKSFKLILLLSLCISLYAKTYSGFDLALLQTMEDRKASMHGFSALKNAKGNSFASKLTNLNASSLRYLLYSTSRLVFINTLYKRVGIGAKYKGKLDDLQALKLLRCKESLSHLHKHKLRWYLKDSISAKLLQNTLNILGYANSCELYISELKGSKDYKKIEKKASFIKAKIKEKRKELNEYFIKQYSKKFEII